MELGVDFYKKLGLPNYHHIMNAQKAKFGSNSLTETDANPWWMILWKQWVNMFALLLQAGGIMSFIA